MNRTPREIEDRELSSRPKAWAPPEVLPEPDKEPGYAYRWIRVSTLGQSDPRNVSAKLREGWEPVMLEEQPKFRLLSDPASRFKDNIEIGGLLLCKTPQEFVDQRDAFYAKKAKDEADAVDSTLMRQSDPRMPMFKERKSSTSFGKGT
ncbi:MAG: hypothetical protein ACOYNN_15040 [Terrimicrobiaceae bacterium]|jgi:hypothetical protein